MGITINSNVSVGDIIAIFMLLCTIAYNYYAIIRRLDRMTDRLKHTEQSFEDLRRGRGLIMESWPQAMQRLMGFRNGAH